MNARQELDSYISQLERRVRLDTLSRGAAIVAAAALGATGVLVLLANARAFSAGSVIGARLILFCILVFAASLGLAIPISRLSRRRAARKAEEMFPEFKQRLVTFAEKKGDADAFLEQDAPGVAFALQQLCCERGAHLSRQVRLRMPPDCIP